MDTFFNKPGFLWLHASQVGHLGSAFAISCVYDLVLRGEDCIFLTDKITRTDLQAHLRSMHSFHPKFRDLQAALPDLGPGIGRGLPLARIRSGAVALTEAEAALYAAAAKDLARLGEVFAPETSSPVMALDAVVNGVSAERGAAVWRVFLDCDTMWGTGGYPQKYEHVRNTLVRLRQVATEMGLCLLATYQLNRPADRQIRREPGQLPRYVLPGLDMCQELEKLPNALTTTYVDPAGRQGEVVVDCLKGGELGPVLGRLGLATGRLTWGRSRSYDAALAEDLRDPREAAAYLAAALEGADEPDGRALIELALENVGRAHGMTKAGPVRDKDHAEALLAALTAFYKEPVMPVRRYCEALKAWARCIGERRKKELDEPNPLRQRGTTWDDHVEKVFLNIRKSNLLYRLIYLGLPLRTRPCPEHKGRWSGLAPEPCPHGCSEGHNVTGWLLPEEGGA